MAYVVRPGWIARMRMGSTEGIRKGLATWQHYALDNYADPAACAKARAYIDALKAELANRGA